MVEYREYKYHKYRTFTRLYPKSIKERYVKLLSYSGLKISPDVFLGFLLFFTVNISLIIAFYMAYFIPPVITVAVSFIVLNIAVYFWFLLQVDAMGQFVEGVLPDALQLMVSNLRAGLTVERALLLSARPEFGVLQDEIKRAGREVMLGKDLSSALSDMTSRIKSTKLERTISLINSSIKAGGELASVLEHSAVNLRHERLVSERIKSNIFNYVIFIFVAIAIGAPMLFGLSSFLVGMVTKTLAGIEIPATAIAGLPVGLGKVNITESFAIQFAILSLTTTAILGSLVLGLISRGESKEGVKFMPFLIIFALLIFFMARFLIGTVLGGLFG